MVLIKTNPAKRYKHLKPFGFAGRQRDRDTSLVYFGGGHYNPGTGRFMQRDPIGFAGGDTNLYRYVLNDPINRIDPTGRTGFRVTGGFDFGGINRIGGPAFPRPPQPDVGIGDFLERLRRLRESFNEKFDEISDFIDRQLCKINPSKCDGDNDRNPFPDDEMDDLEEDLDEARACGNL